MTRLIPMDLQTTATTEELACARAIAAARSAGIARPRITSARRLPGHARRWAVTVTPR